MSQESDAVGKGCALWLVPDEPLFSQVAAEIARLGQKLATPLFEPHITLLAEITLSEEEVLTRAIKVAGALRPFQVELGNVSYLDEYFRCLFVRAVSTGPILKAHRTAREIFRQPGGTPYEPHLSLVYGKLGIETKRKIAAGFASLTGRKFDVKDLLIYRVRGAPSDWNLIKRLAIG